MGLSRRELLIAGIGLGVAGCTSGDSESAASTTTATADTGSATTASTTTTTIPVPIEAPAYSGPASPFVLGVASGDPDATSVVLWTRLMASFEDPGPLDTDYQLALDVARDGEFADLVSSTVVEAPAAHGNTVHAIATDLEPNNWYWYRFRAGAETSPTGRARTMPEGADTPLRFGFSSCQHWETGQYGAHRQLASTELDLFVWLGDYIYENGPSGAGTGARVHNSAEIETLDAYRARYALYRSDSDLQAQHAARPWIVTWDDHEVDNNHAGLNTEDGQDTAAFADRRRAAHQAWWEHMPVRLDPPADALTIYRTAQWGSLVDLHMLDGRQYRAPQPTDGEEVPLPIPGDFGVRRLGPTALDPTHSMLGTEQRQWLETQVATSTARWNVLGNQVYMHGLNAFLGAPAATNTDTWDGYAGERAELLTALAANDTNLVVISGDFHASTTAELRADPYALNTPVLGTEFMAPAISSRFPDGLAALAPVVLGINPQVQHFEPRNGYMTCEVTADQWTTTLHILDDVDKADSAVTTTASFTVNAGTPGIAEIATS